MASKAMERLNKAYEEQHIEKPFYMQEYLRKRAISKARLKDSSTLKENNFSLVYALYPTNSC
jgi:hypothetical protein